MLKEASIIQEWIAGGVEQGVAMGETREARRSCREVLCLRFGELPQPLVDQIESADAEWCRTLLRKAWSVESLSELLP